MRGMIAVDDVIASLPKDRQRKVAARGNELLAKVQRRMTLREIRKGRKISQAKDGRGAWDRPDANLAPGEAEGSTALHYAAHDRRHGWSADDDCDISGSGAGRPCHFSAYGEAGGFPQEETAAVTVRKSLPYTGALPEEHMKKT